MTKKDFDEYIQHLIDIERYGNALASDMENFLDGAEDDIEELIEDYYPTPTKKRTRDATDRAEKILDGLEKKLNDRANSAVSGLTEKETEWFSEWAKIALGITLTALGVTAARKLMAVPFSRGLSPSSFAGSFRKTLSDTVKGIFQAGYALGGTASDALARLRRAFASTRRGLGAEAVTMAGAAARNTQRLMAARHGGLEWVWVAMLDTRTCLECADLDGSVYESQFDAPLAPVHERCRCVLMPVIKGTKLDRMTYSEWLSELDDEGLKRALGPARAKLYMDGMRIDQFVSDGRKLRLDEL